MPFFTPPRFRIRSPPVPTPSGMQKSDPGRGHTVVSGRSLVSSNSGRAQEVTFVRKCFDGVFGWSAVATLVLVGGIGAVLVCVLGFLWEFNRGTARAVRWGPSPGAGPSGRHDGRHDFRLGLPPSLPLQRPVPALHTGRFCPRLAEENAPVPTVSCPTVAEGILEKFRRLQAGAAPEPPVTCWMGRQARKPAR